MQALQEGLVTPLLDIVERSWNGAATAGNMAFIHNATLTEELNGALIMLSNMSKEGWGLISQDTQARIYARLADLYSIHSAILSHGNTLDPVSTPWFATLRARTTLTVASALPTTATNRLIASENDKQNFAVDVGLAGSQLALWQDHNLLYLDNKLSSASQYAVVDSFLHQIPKELQNLMMISVNDFLGNTSALQGRSIGLSYLFGGVNTFSTEVGVASENSFPSGHTPHRSDLFGLALGHEISHNIDSFYISNSIDLTSKRDGLIQSAGTNSQNYLRSMAGGEFFQNAPQEFFASIGNQWFSDTSLTFDLGLARADQGLLEPLNQFLFTADVYSRGGSETVFYQLDTNGQLSSYSVPLSRTGSGAIDGITVNGREFVFDLDVSDKVIGYIEVISKSDSATLAKDGLGNLYVNTQPVTYKEQQAQTNIDGFAAIGASSEDGENALLVERSSVRYRLVADESWRINGIFNSLQNASSPVLDLSGREVSGPLNIAAVAGAYVINGVNNPMLVVRRGQTYTFNLNTGVHRFWLQTTGSGYQSSNVYNDGFTGNSQTTGEHQWVVPEDAPDEIFYQCEFHPVMFGKIIVVD